MDCPQVTVKDDHQWSLTQEVHTQAPQGDTFVLYLHWTAEDSSDGGCHLKVTMQVGAGQA